MVHSVRKTNFTIFIACTLMILAALYMEHVMKMNPCPLCITQRGFVMLTGLIALLAALHNPGLTGQRTYAILGIISPLLGAGFSGRQLWLQYMPAEQVASCGPSSLSYILEEFPLLEGLDLLLQGDGSCAHIDKIFGLSLALWTFIAFIGLAGVNLYQLLRKRDKLA
ncbi:MAG TPA: disulfide bond formation protein B [Cellvibrio sp.]|nr:disulfide bond formation protein B [Cellvibrio sp.]